MDGWDDGPDECDVEAPIYLPHDERQKCQRVLNRWWREVLDKVKFAPKAAAPSAADSAPKEKP